MVPVPAYALSQSQFPLRLIKFITIREDCHPSWELELEGESVQCSNIGPLTSLTMEEHSNARGGRWYNGLQSRRTGIEKS